MTACTNHGGKARRVVTAALVGVLSVGTVPMAALAEGVSDAISPLFAEGGIDGVEFADGSLDLEFKTAVAGGTDPSESTNVDGVTTVSAKDIPFTVSASKINLAGKPNSGIEIGVDTDFKIALYRADEDGNPTGSPLSGSRITAAGGYVLTVTPLTGSEYVGQTFKQYFEVTPVQIDVDDVVENGETTDTDFTFTGQALDLGIVMDGKVLAEGKDYTVKYVGEDGKTYDEVVDAGKYTAKVTGLGIYEGTSDISEVFTVDSFDFSTAQIVVAPYEDMMADHPVSITNGGTGAAAASLDPSLVTLFNTYDEDLTVSGDHKVSARADADEVAKGNIINASSGKDVTAVKVDALASFTYNGEPLADSYDVFLDKGQTFNLGSIIASYNGTQLGVCGDAYVTASGDTDFTTVGEHTFTVTYNAQGDAIVGTDLNGKVVAGSKTVTVRVWDGQLDADKQLYVYGPDRNATDQPVAISSYDKAYDGKELKADDFLVTDKTGAIRNLGGSPALTATLYDSEGNVVDSAVSAGEYTLKVTSDDYKLSGTTELKVTIHTVDLTTAKIGKVVKWNGVAGENYVVLDSAASFATNANAIKDLDLLYAAFDGEQNVPDNVDVTVEYNDEGTWKAVSKYSTYGNGDYRVTLSVGEDVASNYVLPEGENSVTLYFTVAEQGAFKDVQPSAWYYDVVQRAFKNGYMNGTTAPTQKPVYDDSGKIDHYEWQTGVFTPEGTLTRAQVAAVLFNASGADVDETGGAWNEHTGWDTGFSDVDGTQWYGKAVYWAKQNGVINGYADGTFRADQAVTREEFISMLANYAEVVLGDSTVGAVSTDVLADYPDGSSVAGWAAENVAWAASKGIAGNGGTLMPADTMTRAYCAAMVVNYLDPIA